MTRMLDRLEEQGFVNRRRGAENRRVVEVFITPLGRDLIDRLAGDVRRCGRDQLGHLDDDTLREFIALLKRAREPHDRDVVDAWPGNER
jgi:DNA-binding MarR family transcriptional regulator